MSEKILAFNNKPNTNRPIQYENYCEIFNKNIGLYLVSEPDVLIHNQHLLPLDPRIIKSLRAKNDFVLKTPNEVFKSQNGVINLVDKVFVSLPIKNIEKKIILELFNKRNSFINILLKYDNSQICIIGAGEISITYYNVLIETYGILTLKYD
jgi:hypothetical protein